MMTPSPSSTSAWLTRPSSSVIRNFSVKPNAFPLLRSTSIIMPLASSRPGGRLSFSTSVLISWIVSSSPLPMLNVATRAYMTAPPCRGRSSLTEPQRRQREDRVLRHGNRRNARSVCGDRLWRACEPVSALVPEREPKPLRRRQPRDRVGDRRRRESVELRTRGVEPGDRHLALLADIGGEQPRRVRDRVDG